MQGNDVRNASQKSCNDSDDAALGGYHGHKHRLPCVFYSTAAGPQRVPRSDVRMELCSGLMKSPRHLGCGTQQRKMLQDTPNAT